MAPRVHPLRTHGHRPSTPVEYKCSAGQVEQRARWNSALSGDHARCLPGRGHSRSHGADTHREAHIACGKRRGRIVPFRHTSISIDMCRSWRSAPIHAANVRRNTGGAAARERPIESDGRNLICCASESAGRRRCRAAGRTGGWEFRQAGTHLLGTGSIRLARGN